MTTTIDMLYQLYLQHPVVTTDSRNCPVGSLFFALRGETFNGNLFAAKALEAGCALAVVDDPQVVHGGDNRYVVVEDVLTALQDLAAWHRRHFAGSVLQVTGTNGKTTTKELIAAVLSQKYKVLYTQGNLNNHIGVPLTLLRLRLDEHEIAIIETGANHPGEIAALAKIVDPDYGIITNVGVAHIEGFGSFEGVKKTKGELYAYLHNKGGIVFADGNNPHLCSMLQEYGIDTSSERCLLYEMGNIVSCNPFLEVEWKNKEGGKTTTKTQLIGAYNFNNVLAAICIGQYFHVSTAAINAALTAYHPSLGRSEYQKVGTNELIVDAYNANLTSMTASLENFKQIKHPCKWAILGDMKELGTESATAHQQILRLLLSLSLKEIWLVGEAFTQALQSMELEAAQRNAIHSFKDIEEVKNYLSGHKPTNSCILIKGSNSTKLYQLPTLLGEQ